MGWYSNASRGGGLKHLSYSCSPIFTGVQSTNKTTRQKTPMDLIAGLVKESLDAKISQVTSGRKIFPKWMAEQRNN